MSDHLDHEESASGKIDPRVDIADLYVFPSKDAPGRTVLLMTVNPFAPAEGADFATDAVYEILIDTDGDALPDISYRTTFETSDGGQHATVRRAAGADAQSRGVTGTVVVDTAVASLNGKVHIANGDNNLRFFAGIRSDPFFFDLHGYLDDFAFTGADLFADKNVCAIVLEVPNDDLVPGPIGVWCRILVRSHGKLIQIDRMGRPLVNVALTRGIEKDRLNQSDPDQDLALFTATFAGGLSRLGDHNGHAGSVAASLLPDMLPFDPTFAVGYPNGRRLADDIIDHQLTLFTAGRVTTDKVSAHTDISDRFPYLAEPHRTV